ncbi:MAG: sodium:solute symporter, partial [Eggerthellaceae bacterium]|nr:sodium:solute symporter [Eggerthellaceae bacterium]
SLVLTSSSTLTLDLIKGNIKKDMSEKQQLACMRVLLGVFVLLSCVIALVQYTSTITFIAQLMGISWGALAGAFLGPFLWGLYSNKVSRAAVWASFILGVGLTTGNMLAGFMGVVIIASPINAGAIAMVLSLIIVPVVSLFTKSVDFDIEPPSPKSGTDREIEAKLGASDLIAAEATIGK